MRTLPLVKRVKNIQSQPGLGHNRGPYSQYWSTPVGDRMQAPDYRRILDDDYGEGNTIKPGMPYVDVYGSAIIFGKCAHCEYEMIVCQNAIVCVHCKRRLPIQSPRTQKLRDLKESPDKLGPWGRKRHKLGPEETEDRNRQNPGTGGLELAWNTPSQFNMQFDVTQYPQQAPGTTRTNTY